MLEKQQQLLGHQDQESQQLFNLLKDSIIQMAVQFQLMELTSTNLMLDPTETAWAMLDKSQLCSTVPSKRTCFMPREMLLMMKLNRHLRMQMLGVSSKTR